MLNKPILALCDNRRRLARTHPFSGDPEDWLADTYLEQHGLVGFTFDFFVHWATGSIPNQLWIKRVVEDSFDPWPITSSGEILNAIYQCDGEEKVKNLCEFADRFSMVCHYFLFKESPNPRNPPAPIIEITLNGSGSVVDIQEVELSILMQHIQQLRGGPASVGSKGLVYGSTSLECFLSKTSAIWPGDADLVLTDSSFAPRAIIEFKKHTLNSRISAQKLSNYYPRRDPRKYDSLAFLRDYLNDGTSPLPIMVLYYGIKPFFREVKLECVEGAPRELRATHSELVPHPNANDEESCRDFVASLLGIIGL